MFSPLVSVRNQKEKSTRLHICTASNQSLLNRAEGHERVQKGLPPAVRLVGGWSTEDWRKQSSMWQWHLFFFSKFDVYEMFRSRGIWFPPERRAKLKDQMQSGNLYLFTPHHRLGFSGLFSFRFSSHPLEVFLRFQPAAGIPPVLCIHPDTGFYFVCSGHAAVSAWLSTSGTSLAAYPSVVQLRLETVAVPHRSLHRIKQTSRQSVKRTYACVAAMAHF